MTIDDKEHEYLSFFEKIDLLEKLQLFIKDHEDTEMVNGFNLWLKEMKGLGHIGYPKDKFRGIEDL